MTVKCRLLPFDDIVTVGGMVHLDDDTGTYTVYINSNVCDLRRRRAFGHEMAHIILDHLNQLDRGIMEQEAEANSRAWDMYRKYRKEYNAMQSGQLTFDI